MTDAPAEGLTMTDNADSPEALVEPLRAAYGIADGIETTVVSRTLLHEAADRIEALERENAQMFGRRHWPESEWGEVSGALADAGNLPGDLLPSEAIRRLTAERDEAVALLREAVGPLAVSVDCAHDCLMEGANPSHNAAIGGEPCWGLRVRAFLARTDKEKP